MHRLSNDGSSDPDPQTASSPPSLTSSSNSDGCNDDTNVCCILNFSQNATTGCNNPYPDKSYLVDVYSMFESDAETMRCPNTTSTVPHRFLNIPYCTQQVYQIVLFSKQGCDPSGEILYLNDVRYGE